MKKVENVENEENDENDDVEMESIVVALFATKTTQELLDFDSLAFAEEITGKSYKDDEETSRMSMGLSIVSNKILRERMIKEGDTNSQTTIPELQSYLAEEGFDEIYKKAHTRPHKNSDGTRGEEPYEDTTFMYVYWNDELQAMVYFTTYMNVEVVDDCLVYNDQTINSGSFRYTLKQKDGVKIEGYNLSSCSYDLLTGTIRGDHDIRNGWRHNLNNLKKYYNFVKWEGSQFLWLLHYLQHPRGEEYDYNAINAEVIEQFPDYVKKAIAGKYSNSPDTLEAIKNDLITSYFSQDELDKKFNENQVEQDNWFNEFKQVTKYVDPTPNPHNSKNFLKAVERYKTYIKKGN